MSILCDDCLYFRGDAHPILLPKLKIIERRTYNYYQQLNVYSIKIFGDWVSLLSRKIYKSISGKFWI